MFPALLVSAMLSVGLGIALPVSGYSIEMPSMGLGPSLRIATTIPATFPQTAQDIALVFNCGTELNTIASDANWSTWKAANKIQATKTSLKVGTTNASCDKQYRLTVSDPKLFSLLAPKQYEGKLYNSGRAGFLTDASTTTFDLEFPAQVLFSRKGNILSVTANRENLSVAFRQGEPKMIPLSFQGNNTPVKFNAKKPFSIHITANGGKTWQNIAINLANPTISFWLSETTPDGDWPKDY